MAGRRSAQEPQVRSSQRGVTAADLIPRCAQGCGFVGHPDERATPYANCGGDPARHVRPPLRGQQ